MKWAIEILAAFIGSMGFSLFFNIEKDKILRAGIAGAVGWGTYLVTSLVIKSDPVSYFMATIVITFYAEYLAKREKTPVTVFLVSGSIPMIPGGLLYRTMSFAVKSDWEQFGLSGINTLVYAFAMAMGMLVGMSVIQVIRKG